MARRASVALMTVAVAMGLAGCAPASPAPAETSDAVDWPAAYDAFFAEHGEAPPRGELSEEEALAEQARRAQAAWERQVLAQYPDAVYPTEGFVRWQVPEDQTSLMSDLANCMTSRGLLVDQGVDADGNPVGLGSSGPSTVQTAVAQFYCGDVAFPTRPRPEPSDELLEWLWSYGVEFLGPCLEDHGYPQDPTPPLAEYLERPTWFPDFVPDDRLQAVQTDCPPWPRGA